MTRTNRCSWLSLSLAAFAAAGCGGGGDAGGQAESSGQGAGSAAMESPVDAATAGTITGGVMFAGTAPEATMIDMAEEDVCEQKGQRYGESVVVNDNGSLGNVFVYVKQGLEGMSFPVPQTPVEIDQNGCWYIPRVLGIQVGQELLIKNSDGVLHNINAKPEVNRVFNISQPVVMECKRAFRAAEVMVPLECDVHGWMQAFVGVLDHPYYAVTGADGSFDLAPLPPGTYVVEAWHERYGTQTQEITVGTSEEVEVSFTFGDM